jgi:hypothetical protein|eukprot:m.366999 g.366999  ORF g.366999 m.366999 type:complete len:108 (-) comp28097_c0_seq12:1658-1981(-)
MGRKVFCLYTGSTITPPNMLQQINRERKISDVCFYFETQKYTPPLFNNKIDCSEFTKEQNRPALKQFVIVYPQLNMTSYRTRTNDSTATTPISTVTLWRFSDNAGSK